MNVIFILTRYRPATDKRGSRILATTIDGKRHIMPYRHEHDRVENHKIAAMQLIQREGMYSFLADARHDWDYAKGTFYHAFVRVDL